jgi:flagellar hook-associated protein 3 FlgL
MVTRVTNQTMMLSASNNLQANAARLARLQEQASTQKAITRPSDDPAATADSLRVRSEQRANAQYGRNIDNASGWLTTVDSTLSATTAILRRVRDLTVQGANDGSMSATAKEAIAIELEGLKNDLLVQANTKYVGRTIFAGNSDSGAAFTVTYDATATPPNTYTFNGTNGSTVERRINAETTVRVDADGSVAFGVDSASTTSVFALVDGIVSDLRAGTNVGYRLTEIDSRMDAIVGERAAAGARQAQVQRAQETTMDRSVSLEAQRSAVEDSDLGQVILSLKLQEVAYQSTLAVTARVLQPTLMDFLR